MNFDQLLYFREIALTNSFTQAAENLYITQAGLTYQIKQLENELGFKLFDRDSHHVTLTEQGAILKPAVESMLAMWDEAYRWAKRSLTDSTMELHVGLMELMDDEAVLRVNRALRDIHPSCEVVPDYMRPLMYQERIKDLVSGRLDLSFISDDEIGSATSLAFVPLGPMYYGALLRADDPLAGRESITFEDLAGRKILFPSALLLAENKTRLESITRRLSRVSPSVDGDVAADYKAMDMMVADVGAVGIQVYSSTKGIDESRFAMVPIVDGEEPIRFGIVYIRDTHNPLVLDFVRLAQEEFQRQV